MKKNDDGSDLCWDANRLCEESTWNAIVERYRPLLIAWAVRCPATAETGESAETIADQALARAWLALSSQGFGSFPNLATFLSYLRMCVTHTAIDMLRVQAAQTRISQSLVVSEATNPEQGMLEQLGRTELWQLMNGLVRTEQEQVALVERFVLDLPPRIIQARHPTLFADKKAVYYAVRHVCEQLRRSCELYRLLGDRLAA